jgi:predicted nucleic acid-binding protein
MNEPVLADTGPLYALADPSDQYHHRAQAELDRLNSTNHIVAITYLTLAEAYTLVLRRLGTAYAHQWLREILDAAMLINPEPGDYLKACGVIPSFRDQSITLFDAVAVAVSQRLDLSVWTYDRHFPLSGARRWT